MGVTSARIDVKRAAARAERWLERYAEPLTALHVAPDDVARAVPPPRLAAGPIESSAHDSIGGCSIDPVVDQVLVRFAEAEEIASGLARRAAATVAAAVPRGSLAVLNPSPRRAHRPASRRSRACRTHGRRSRSSCPMVAAIATQELARSQPILLETDLRGDQADDLFRRFHGREVFDHAWNGYRIDGRTLTLEVDAEPEPASLDVEGLRAEITAAMRAAPAETWRVRIVARPRRTLVRIGPRSRPRLDGRPAGRGRAASSPTPVRVSPDGRSIVERPRRRSRSRDDGTLRVEAADGTVAEGVGRIVDGGDFGDAYNHAPPAVDTIVEAPRERRGPGRAARAGARAPRRRSHLRLAGRPRARRLGPHGRAGRDRGPDGGRAARRRALRPHRSGLRQPLDRPPRALRATLPRPATASHAEGQFAVVERGLAAEGGYREEPLPTYPARGWVDAGGLAVLLDHVTEYELTDGGRELALTVLALDRAPQPPRQPVPPRSGRAGAADPERAAARAVADRRSGCSSTHGDWETARRGRCRRALRPRLPRRGRQRPSGAAVAARRRRRRRAGAGGAERGAHVAAATDRGLARGARREPRGRSRRSPRCAARSPRRARRRCSASRDRRCRRRRGSAAPRARAGRDPDRAAPPTRADRRPTRPFPDAVGPRQNP